MNAKKLSFLLFIDHPLQILVIYTQNLCNILEQMVVSNPNIPIWIGGDLNLPNIDWSNSSVLIKQLISNGSL